MTTAREVENALRRHYLPENRPQAGVLVTEINSPCGRRRADAIWAPLNIGHGGGIVGHEIKVSRADVITELCDMTKADPWAKYCTRWWLTVSDPALVDGLQIPESWGIMAPPSGRRTRSMTILKDAPKLTPEEPSPAWRRILAKVHFGTADTISDLSRDLTAAERALTAARAEITSMRRAGAVATPDEKAIASILDEVRHLQRDRPEIRWTELSTSAIASAVVDQQSLNVANQRAMNHLRGLERSLRDLATDTQPAIGAWADEILARIASEEQS